MKFSKPLLKTSRAEGEGGTNANLPVLKKKADLTSWCLMHHTVTGLVQSLQLVYSLPLNQKSLLKLDVRLISGFCFTGNDFQLQSFPKFCPILTHFMFCSFAFKVLLSDVVSLSNPVNQSPPVTLLIHSQGSKGHSQTFTTVSILERRTYYLNWNDGGYARSNSLWEEVWKATGYQLQELGKKWVWWRQDFEKPGLGRWFLHNAWPERGHWQKSWSKEITVKYSECTD